MARTTLATPYAFYRMPEKKRIEMIGSHFYVTGRDDSVYFPIGLSGCFNYGIDQGLLSVPRICTVPGATDSAGKPAKRNWFKVGAFSPDDLDLDLEFEHDQCWMRQDVIAYIARMHKRGVTYLSCLEEIRDHFKAGRLYR
jgi:hypothetical protein